MEDTLVPATEAGMRFLGAREILGMSQDELAKWLGVHRHTIARWEQEGPTRVAGLAMAYLLSVQPNLRPSVARKYAASL